MAKQDPHVAAAIKYAKQVGANKIPANKWVKLACARFLSDLVREDLVFRPEMARRPCRFIEQLPHVKGRWAQKSERIKLQPWQCFALVNLFGFYLPNGRRRFSEAYIKVPRKNGKALAVETPVLTTRGWVEHGALRAGDRVFAPDGRSVAVLATTEHYLGPCYELELSDRSRLVAHAAHEWRTARTVHTGRAQGSRAPLPLVDTETIAATLTHSSRGDRTHKIACALPLQAEGDVPIPAYTLGVWLGDGTTRVGQVTTPDAEIWDRVASDGFHVGPHIGGEAKSCPQRTIYGLQQMLRSHGLLGAKHIPSVYLYAAQAHREALLAGIVDTDGHVTPRGQVQVTLTNERLARDVMKLVCTLGMKPTMSISRAMLYGKDCGPAYNVSFWARTGVTCVLLPRKAAQLRASTGRALGRTIARCDSVGERLVNCIQVEGGMYLAGESLVATHNSILAAGVGLYCLVADSEYGAEVYSGASTEKQAWEVFRPARLMAQKCDELREHFGIEVNAKTLAVPGDGSRFEPVIGKPGDGSSPSCALVDEYHEHKTSDLYDTMITGMGARENPLALVITTAGSNIEGPCHDREQDCEKILDGVFVDDHVFALMYGIDEKDDWKSDAAIRKANPNLGVSVSFDYLKQRRDEALRRVSVQGTYQTKHLNRWVQAGQAFINLVQWQKAADRTLKIADFEGDSCVFGVDLSSRVAFTAVVRLFWRIESEGGNTKRHWYAFARLALPAARLTDGTNVRFSQWAKGGYLDVHDEDEIDFARLRADVKADAELYTPAEIAFDPWRAMGLEQELAAEGMTMVRIPQTFGQYTAPMDELEAALISGRFHHDGNPAFTWMASNLSAKVDGNRNKKPANAKAGAFIDGMVALLMAMNRGMANDAESQTIDTDYLRGA